MLDMHTITNRFSEFRAERELARSVDAFIADLEQLAAQPADAVELNNVRARVEAMVDLLEGRLEWSNVDQARRLVTRVYDIRIAEEMVLTRLRGEQLDEAQDTLEDPLASVAGLLN
jgi:hypothetical protein